MHSGLRNNNAASDTAYVHEWVNSTCEVEQANSESFVSEAADSCLAARLYCSCVQVLRDVCSQASGHKTSPAGVSWRVLREELGRLYLCGDIFRSGKLNKILDNADELRETVVEVLAAVGRLLTQSIALPIGYKASGIPDQYRQNLQELETLVEQSTTTISDGPTNDDSDSEKEDDDSETSSISESIDLEEDLRSRVQMTLDLVPTLDLTLEHVEGLQKRSRSTATKPFSASNPAGIYISLVRDRFPKADNRLVERLGEANWQRHLNIRKRIDEQDGNGEIEGISVRSTFQPPTLFHDSGIGTTLAAKSEYAQSEASHASFNSSPADSERGVVRVPPTPVEVSLGEPFRCNICGQMQSRIRHRVDWKLHVFKDLLPYICTFTGCNDELRQFPSRKEWAEHELQEHRSYIVWACPECSEECCSTTAWSTHLQEAHGRAFAASQTSSAADAARRKRPRPNYYESCCLCNENLPSDKDIKTHVAKHMEEIALMALPKKHEERSEDIYDPDEVSEASRESQNVEGKLLSSSFKSQPSLETAQQAAAHALDDAFEPETHFSLVGPLDDSPAIDSDNLVPFKATIPGYPLFYRAKAPMMPGLPSSPPFSNSRPEPGDINLLDGTKYNDRAKDRCSHDEALMTSGLRASSSSPNLVDDLGPDFPASPTDDPSESPETPGLSDPPVLFDSNFKSEDHDDIESEIR